MLCFRQVLVAKKFVDKRGGYQDYQPEKFCITAPKILVGESFVVSQNSGVKKYQG